MNPNIAWVSLTRMCIFAATTIAISVPSPRAHGEDSQDLLKLVTSGHRAATEAIRTLSSTFVVEKTLPEKEVLYRGEYLRSLDLVRIRVGVEGEWQSDFLVKDGETRVVDRFWYANKPVNYGAERKSSAQMIGPCDMWMGLLVTIVGPKGEPMSIERLLQCAKRPPRASRQELDGRKCIRVNLEFDDPKGDELRFTIWHDIGCNYLVRKKELTYDGHGSEVWNIAEFAESAPGVFVPAQCIQQSFSDSKLQDQYSISLSNIQVNRDLPPATFDMPAIPTGTSLKDRTNDTE